MPVAVVGPDTVVDLEADDHWLTELADVVVVDTVGSRQGLELDSVAVDRILRPGFGIVVDIEVVGYVLELHWDDKEVERLRDPVEPH